MMNVHKYDSVTDWTTEAEELGYSVESWGMCGSKSAHDRDGRIRGEWIAAFDTCDGRASGWLDVQ